MDRHLGAATLAQLLLYAVLLTVGQILFKQAALSAVPGVSTGQRLLGLLVSPTFLLAILLYAALSAYWVWLLSFIPLSRAYPFVALAFVLTLASGVIIFSEPLSWRLVTGGALIVLGLLVIAT